MHSLYPLLIKKYLLYNSTSIRKLQLYTSRLFKCSFTTQNKPRPKKYINNIYILPHFTTLNSTHYLICCTHANGSKIKTRAFLACIQTLQMVDWPHAMLQPHRTHTSLRLSKDHDPTKLFNRISVNGGMHQTDLLTHLIKRFSHYPCPLPVALIPR